MCQFSTIPLDWSGTLYLDKKGIDFNSAYFSLNWHWLTSVKQFCERTWICGKVTLKTTTYTFEIKLNWGLFWLIIWGFTPYRQYFSHVYRRRLLINSDHLWSFEVFLAALTSLLFILNKVNTEHIIFVDIHPIANNCKENHTITVNVLHLACILFIAFGQMCIYKGVILRDCLR